jgi:hypothetical protein
MRNICKILVGKLEGRDHSEDIGVDWRIILEWILESRFGGWELDLSGSG